MQIYKPAQLYNRYVQNQTSEAVAEGLISASSFQKIKEAHADTLYTPNFFIRVALVLLTGVALIFSTALFGMLFWSSDSSIIVGLVFMAMLCYGALELFAGNKKYYNAGVDNALMIAILLFITSAFFVNDFYMNTRLVSMVMMLLCGWLCLRFTDAFMAVLCYLSFTFFLFSNLIELDGLFKLIAPLVIMACSAVVYFMFQRLRRKAKDFHSYHRCHTAVALFALLTLYVSGNYLVVNGLSIELFGAPLTTSNFMAGLFWVFTIAIPFIYVAAGVATKDRLLIRTGLLLIAAAVYTVRFYYDILPLEITMFILGMILITASYASIRYLHTPKQGFIFKKKKSGAIPVEQVESLLTAEQFGAAAPVEAGFEFGGGSGGGGGATGSY